jgi:hypothetical protein
VKITNITCSINPGIAITMLDSTRIRTSHLLDDTTCRMPRPLNGRVAITLDLDLRTLSPGSCALTYGVRDESERSPALVILENYATDVMPRNGAYRLLWNTGH